MNRLTSVVAGLLLAGAYPISAEDVSVEEAVKVDVRAIGQTQGAGTPNAIGAGAFIPLHTTSNAVTYIDVEAKANLDDRSGDSSIINTDVAGVTLSTSARIGYRWINDIGSWMYGSMGAMTQERWDQALLIQQRPSLTPRPLTSSNLPSVQRLSPTNGASMPMP